MQNRLSKLVNTQAQRINNGSRVNFTLLGEGIGYPLVISPKSSGLILNEWVGENRELFGQKLKTHGAILLRGFKIDTVEKFRDFIGVFDGTPLEYKQRSSPRFEVAKNIYHSTTYPREFNINMHSENSYAFNWARRIVFCCIQPAEEQGETPVADNRLVVKHLSDATRAKFRERGVKYVRNISKGIGLPWQEVFQTDDKAVVEEECRKSGMAFQWEGEDRLVLTWNNEAIYHHPDTSEPVWFNHAFFFNKYALGEEAIASFDQDEELPFNTYYGDGSEITREEIEEIRQAYEKSTVVFPWVKGDVLFMDNMMCAHGRRPYKGERQIIVSMF